MTNKPDNWERVKERIIDELQAEDESIVDGVIQSSYFGFHGAKEKEVTNLMYALAHKDEFDGLLNNVSKINVKLDINSSSLGSDFIIYNSPILNIESINIKNLDDVVYTLNEYTETKDKLASIVTKCNSINIKCQYGSKNSKEKLIEFLKLFEIDSNQCTINVTGLNLKDIIIISNIDNNINYGNHKVDSQLKTLFDKFYNGILNGGDVETSVKKACEYSKSTDGNVMPYSRALDQLSQFDWDFLEKADIVSDLKLLYNNLEVKSEYYHEAIPVLIKQTQEKSDVHFYMTKVTKGNKDAWDEFATKQYKGHSKSGVTGFQPTLKYYDYYGTDVWVNYASSEKMENPHLPSNAIEMMVTVNTSGNSPFTGHMGITRSVTYTGCKHKDLAMKLHSFGAKVSSQHYGNKHYMITAPDPIMRKIFVDSIREKFDGDMSHIYLGHDKQTYPDITLDQAIKNHNACVANGFYTTDRMIGRAHEARLKEDMLRQKELLFGENGKKNEPVSYDKEAYAECTSFVLRDDNGTELCNLENKDMHGELSWFFDHPWFIKNAETSCLNTVKLDDLAELIAHNEIDYSESIC